MTVKVQVMLSVMPAGWRLHTLFPIEIPNVWIRGLADPRKRRPTFSGTLAGGACGESPAGRPDPRESAVRSVARLPQGVAAAALLAGLGALGRPSKRGGRRCRVTALRASAAEEVDRRSAGGILIFESTNLSDSEDNSSREIGRSRLVVFGLSGPAPVPDIERRRRPPVEGRRGRETRR